MDAWDNHVKSWMSDKIFLSRASSTILNRLNDPIPVGESTDSFDMVPDNLFTGCFYEDDQEWRPKDTSFISNWTGLDDDEILDLFGDDGSRFVQRGGYNGFWPCLVLKRYQEDDNDAELYIVRIFHPSKTSVKTWWHDNGVPRFLTKFPRESIRYFYKPYQSDLFLKGAFRHFIEIPDDMFPEMWRDNIDSPTEDVYSNISQFHVLCKFRPGDKIEVKLDTKKYWLTGKVNRWCEDTNYYSVSLDDEMYNNFSRTVILSNIRWPRTKRLGSSNWHPFF